MNDAVLLFEAVGPIAHLNLNRPKAMNAMNLATLTALAGYLDEIARRDELRVVVLTGKRQVADARIAAHENGGGLYGIEEAVVAVNLFAKH